MQRKLREFIGLVNFYRRFIPHGATLFWLLYTLLKHTRRPSDTLEWPNTAVEAFKAFTGIKTALASALLLCHPVPDAPMAVMIDASAMAVGVVLQQYINCQWRTLSFFSRALKPAEQWYSTYDCELLAWQYTLQSNISSIFWRRDTSTSLQTISPSSMPSCNDSTATHPTKSDTSISSQFTTDMCHVQGSANAPADVLSHVGANALHTDSAFPVVDFCELALAQARDPCLTQLQSTSSLCLEHIPLVLFDGVFIMCDVSTGTQHPYVSKPFHRAIFDSLHSMSYPNICSTQFLVTSRFVWPSSNADVRCWACTCH